MMDGLEKEITIHPLLEIGIQIGEKFQVALRVWERN